MSDLDPKQRMDRARRAAHALTEFLDPAFNSAHETYLARMKEVVSKEPWATEKISALVTAMRILDAVHTSIGALVADGDVAKVDLDRIENVSSMSAMRRKAIGI